MKISSVFVLLLLFSIPAFAADAPADIKERTALAQEFHKVRPLKPQIDDTLALYGASLSKEGKANYERDIQKVFDYKAVEEASVKAMAETYTVPELKAMIEYYSKPEAHSAVAKNAEYVTKYKPAVRAALDKAMTDLVYPKK